MALRGRAFLAIWHDIAEGGEADYNRWHTRQHMPERVGIPGFLSGRRYVGGQGANERYFTLYEVATLETLGSEDYRARLNAPTAWSRRVQPLHVNVTRSACLTAASLGRGHGGAIATIRLDFAADHRAEIEAAAERLAAALLAEDGIVGVHVGIAESAVTGIRTEETKLRKDAAEDRFDAVVLVEGIGRSELEQAMPAVRAAILGACPETGIRPAIYDLAYLLAAEGPAA